MRWHETEWLTPRKGKNVKKKAKKVMRHRTWSSVNIKMAPAEAKAIGRMADRFANGNLSAWLRHAGLKYVPKRDEKVAKARWGMFPKKK